LIQPCVGQELMDLFRLVRFHDGDDEVLIVHIWTGHHRDAVPLSDGSGPIASRSPSTTTTGPSTKEWCGSSGRHQRLARRRGWDARRLLEERG
jgi:hypothetical protein